MSSLLIHSMSEFASLIVPALDAAGASRVVEIGAEHGGMSQILADYAELKNGELVSVDPAPSRAFLDWLPSAPRVTHVAKPSLEALPEIGAADAWLIDGDHNWFTVYHELGVIRELCRKEGRPLLAFLHDVGWPCGRRDFYYAPERIPEEFRHEYDYDSGVSLDTDLLLPNRGFRGRGAFAWAVHAGGPRNGVMTAVEDFLRDCHEKGEEMAFAFVPAVFGLGVLFDLDAPWRDALAGIFVPFHEHPLIAKLEENRLRNYLRIIDIQDASAVQLRRNAAGQSSGGAA